MDDASLDVPEVPLLVSEEQKLSSLNITALEVKSILENLPLGKAVGRDGINNRVLRELPNELADPLSLFYNLSLQNSKVPDDWKEAHVCPIHKVGDPVLVSNYRPVSLLNTFPVSILRKSISGRHRPVRVADGPMTARCRFM